MNRLRPRLASARAELALIASLRILPPRVALFVLRARLLARRRRDRFSLASAARSAELAALIDLAGPSDAVVELGTGTAWTAIALALVRPTRRVITYDPVVRREREDYLRLAGADAAGRVELREDLDSAGPRPDDPPVQVLFIDSSHEREPTVVAFGSWRAALAPGAVVVFHDHGHPEYPGVAEAVAELGLRGQATGGLYVWRAPTG